MMTNIDIIQNEDGTICVKEEEFFRYLNAVRAMLAEFSVTSRSFVEYAQLIDMTPEDKNNFNIDKNRLDKVMSRASKFNEFMMNYENDRRVAYQFFLINNNENNTQ